jgi:hypothetical protein
MWEQQFSFFSAKSAQSVKSLFRSVVAADDAIGVGGATEVEQQTDLKAGGAEIVVELTLGVTMQMLGRFDFNDQPVIYDHVESVVRNLDSGIPHDDVELSSHPVPSRTQLDFQRCRMDVLAEAEAQPSVNREEGPDDGAGELLFEQFHANEIQRAERPGPHQIIALETGRTPRLASPKRSQARRVRRNRAR